MNNHSLTQQLCQLNIDQNIAQTLSEKIIALKETHPPKIAWQKISKTLLATIKNFAAHLLIYKYIYQENMPPYYQHPIWISNENSQKDCNLGQFLKQHNYKNYDELFAFSHQQPAEFWHTMITQLNIRFQQPYLQCLDLSNGVSKPRWLVNGRLNISDSCFNADPQQIAIIAYDEAERNYQITYGELAKLVNRVANSLISKNIKPNDCIAIDMAMTIEAVAIYLAVVKVGAAVVAIADSFAADEIATRLRIAPCKLVFTQDFLYRAGKQLPLYEKVIAANAPTTIVLPGKEKNLAIKLRSQDVAWTDFLKGNDEFKSVNCESEDFTNILFSSGTTGDPKAIPWTHTTPIKAAVDGYFHCDIKPGDCVAWPTNLGWMMGPWLIYATFINQATMALYYGAPNSKGFAQFIEKARMTQLGVVPSLVNTWRETKIAENVDWSSIKLFASTGECSNAEDMFYLSYVAGYKPIIEYCGGTEIGGAYITNTVLHDNIPATFTTAALGLDFVLLNEQGVITNNGEVALIPPSIGLSTTLLNRDHEKVYFADMPKANGKTLRRHGDQIIQLKNNLYQALGRVDDTMNLGGIKTSSADIERVLNEIEMIKETAAVAINPAGGGPSLLVVYVVSKNNNQVDKNQLIKMMQQRIKENLNPLFKIHDVIITDHLPRTASNKVMRRVLRNEYGKSD